MSAYKDRLFYLLGIIVILFAILFGRVTFLTFFNGNAQETKSELRVQRGVIYDRRGIELALSQDSSTIGINPSNIYDPAFTGAQLSPYTGIPAEKIEAMIRDKSNYFLLKREVDNTTAKKIMEMSLPGVRQEKEFRRVYPNGSLASNLIGFTGMDDDRALSGVEFLYHKELLTSADTETMRGNDVHLTIDSLIQYKLEAALGKAFHESRSKKAIGIFMDVHTGKILAMASFPNFNPNKYFDYSAEATTNWAIRHVYEPGSTMKIFMAMILLNEKAIDPDEKFYCPGYVEFGNTTIRCTDQHGPVDLEEILQYSCNVGIIKAVRKISDEKLYDYLKNFMFGQKTGFSPYENKGYFPELKKWNPSTSFFLSIGQGISVTPIQLVTSAAAIVNGGKILTPLSVSGITNSYGEFVHQFQPTFSQMGIHERSTKQMLRAMTKVVQSGTGKNAYLHDYLIAGKTGTGQKARGKGGYSDDLFSASFLGFFPADNPRIVGLVLFDEPGGVIHSGGGLAAPVFRQVVENIVPIIESSES
ncbi:MAG: penicillin-binding protein 2, partial [Leptospira sp.]|nr:penicillin-binding protein 2 [Leptospira sp.]